MKPRKIVGMLGVLFLSSACGSGQSPNPSEQNPNTSIQERELEFSSCFDNQTEFTVVDENTLIDGYSGQQITLQPAMTENDLTAADHPDYCGKWANELQQRNGSAYFIFRTSESCASRPGPEALTRAVGLSNAPPQVLRDYLNCTVQSGRKLTSEDWEAAGF